MTKEKEFEEATRQACERNEILSEEQLAEVERTWSTRTAWVTRCLIANVRHWRKKVEDLEREIQMRSTDFEEDGEYEEEDN